jgi:hypothetical protein
VKLVRNLGLPVDPPEFVPAAPVSGTMIERRHGTMAATERPILTQGVGFLADPPGRHASVRNLPDAGSDHKEY